MSIKGLTIDNDVEQQDTDTLGGGTFTLDTGLYPMVIDTAYLDKSSGGAMALKLHLKQAEGGNTVVKTQFWLTSGKAKGRKNYYVKDGKKILLPGMVMGDQIAQIAAGAPLATMTPEEKTIKLWDFDAGAEKPTKVAALLDLVGQPILVGMQKVRENKRALSNGEWVDTNDERLLNEVHKVFHPDGFSVAEKAAEAEEPVFVETWKKRNNSDYVRDKFKPVAGGSSQDHSLPSASSSAATEALFNEDEDV